MIGTSPLSRCTSCEQFGPSNGNRKHSDWSAFLISRRLIAATVIATDRERVMRKSTRPVGCRGQFEMPRSAFRRCSPNFRQRNSPSVRIFFPDAPTHCYGSVIRLQSKCHCCESDIVIFRRWVLILHFCFVAFPVTHPITVALLKVISS